MTDLPFFRGAGLALAAAALLLPALGFAQADPQSLRSLDELRVERPAGAGAAVMRIAAPDGSHREIAFAPDEAITLDEAALSRIAGVDGEYVWEVRFQWAQPRSRDGDAASPGGHSVIEPAFGSMRRVDGALHVARASGSDADADGEVPMPSDVISGDLTVNDSLCVGFDCVAAESYGSDTVRLKENNTRLHFEDTSNSGSFPGNDWTLIANEQDNGGLNMFAIQDRTAGRNLMTLQAGAPANSLFMNSQGNVGLGTASPAVELHVADGDSPSVRLDQTVASGFTAQVWDVVGNEANFFIRDVTGGSNLVFRLIPGAPENSIYVAPSGNVGLGTSAPAAKLHVANGDLRVDGSVYQLSSRAVKTGFTSIDSDRLLGLVDGLDLGVWRYRSGPDDGRHFGPAAEDFHAAFGLGEGDDRISLSDMAGVALGAAQALKRELDEKEREIEALEARLERLEKALLADREEP